MQQFYANGLAMPVKTDRTTQVTVYPPRHIHNQNVFLQDPIKKIVTPRTGINTTASTNLKTRRIEDSFNVASATVREVFDVSSRYPRDLFDTGSGAVREVFDCCSGGSRRTIEAHPKQYRSCPEPVPKRTRSAPEGHPNSTRRNRLVFHRFLGILKAGIKYRCSKDVVPFTQPLRKIAKVPLMYRECTVSVRGVYRKGTGDLLRSYWRSTTDLLNTCTSGVDKRYSKSRKVVGVEAMKNKVTLCLTGLLCFMLFNLSEAWAQSAEPRTAEGQTEIKPLKIGDTIPEELWHMPLQVVNHPDGHDTITLNDYRDKKLIILDFWSTWCGSCIAGFPKFIQLQKQFSEDMAFIPVTYQGEQDIASIISTHANFRGLTSPIAIDDKTLNKYFPHLALPHVVWIDPAGRLEGLTGSQHITELSIKQFFEKEKLDWAVKDEDAVLMDAPIVATYKRDSLSNYNNDFQYSFLSGYTAGLPRYHLYSQIDTASGYKVVRFANHSIYNLYMKGLGKFMTPIHENLIVIDGDRLTLDQLKFRDTGNQTSDNWYKENGLTYELRVPAKMDLRSIGRRLIQDLNFYLDIEVAFEDRVRDCWVLKVVDFEKFEKIKSSGGDKVEKLITDDPIKVLRNIRIAKLVDALNYLNITKRVVNGVEYVGLIDLEIEAPDLLDIVSLNKAIRPYGLRFDAEDRLINVLVFKDVLRKGGGI